MSESEWSSEEIRDLRSTLKLSQKSFAYTLGVTYSTVNRWENGHSKPSKLAQRVLGILADSLSESANENL